MRWKNERTGRIIEHSMVQCDSISVYSIYSKEGKHLGNAIVANVPAPANGLTRRIAHILIDMCIYEQKDRKHGAGGELLEVMKLALSKIVTGSSTKKGRRLCLKHGFQVVELKEKWMGETDFLMWDKETEDAKEV